MSVQDDIDRAYTYSPPKGDQPQRYVEIRATAKAFAELLVAKCPHSRELSVALTKLEEVVMWSNASIARNE